MIYTTLNKIEEKNPCSSGWGKLLKTLGKTEADDEKLGFDVILESNGVEDCIWATRVLSGEDLKQSKLFICDVAERSLKFVKEGEERPRLAIEAARNFINGNIDLDELKTATRNASAAYASAAASAAAASAAADASDASAASASASAADASAASAADASAASAADASAAYAAYADASAAYAAYAAADASAAADAIKVERTEQKEMFNKFIRYNEVKG